MQMSEEDIFFKCPTCGYLMSEIMYSSRVGDMGCPKLCDVFGGHDSKLWRCGTKLNDYFLVRVRKGEEKNEIN